MDPHNFLIKNNIDQNINNVSEFFNDFNHLAVPLGLALHKQINNSTSSVILETQHISDGVIDNTLYEKLIKLVTTDNYKPNISIKDKIINIRSGKQLTKKSKKHKLNKTKKI